MKKIFTLIALMACFMGAKAEEKVDVEVDFSKFNDISEFSFFSWKGSESAMARLSIQDGCLHFHSEEATDPSWDCQFFPIGGVNAEVGVTYTLHYKIKGSVAQNVSMLGFGQTPYGQFAITTDWVEGTVDYEATSGDGNILMQCGDYVGDWDIAYLKITHDEVPSARPVEWIELLTNGDAEQPWGDLAETAYNDQENNYKICAWTKEKGVNLDENGAWNPFPARIEEVDGSNVFVVHGQVADTEGDPSAWDNQFWIEAPRELKVGSQFKLSFRYKASAAATTNTQFHHQNPSDYVHWQAIGDINFTTEWQTYEGTVTVPDAATQAWSIAFNLNPQNKDAVDFYFDDISLSLMKLDEGFFVATSNADKGIAYDYDNAIEFTDAGDGLLTATIGTAGKKNTWVNEVQISTVRGHRGSFLGATIKPSGVIDGTEDGWLDYTAASNAKIKLPAAGVYTIYIDPEGMQIVFVKVEGEENKAPIDIVANPTEVIVKGLERDDLADGTNQDGTIKINEEEGGTGQPWDNQFFIVANRALSKGEVTVISFKYKASVAGATSGTQLHGDPGAYMHWSAIGSFNFTEEYQDFETTLTIPAEADQMKSIAFNMAEIKGACDYYIKDVIWKTEDGTETLIDMTGAKNFFVKEGAGTTPYEFGTDPNAINSVVAKAAAGNGAIYNLAGQRVNAAYKGLVIKDGKKYIAK
jgi:hypothetical protein